jgi:hypothetical protein
MPANIGIMRIFPRFNDGDANTVCSHLELEFAAGIDIVATASRVPHQ